ncbi:MAG: hypothetical protein KDK27_16715, partial [Leptospiraceae bacterium]|nr:hypothetical protein [Leptospiraceae bacterium]
MPMVAGNEADESGVWEITGPVAALPLYRKMRILADPRGEFDPSIAEDRLASDSIRNSARRSEPPFLGLSSGAHWARITIKNNGQRTNFVLVNEFRRVQELELFSPDGRIYRTGMDIPIADRSLPIDELALPLEVGIGETKSILLRIRGES